MEVGDACLTALSRASARRRGSEADTLDSISGAQAYDRKNQGRAEETLPGILAAQ
jgi:hypothetical protein